MDDFQEKYQSLRLNHFPSSPDCSGWSGINLRKKILGKVWYKVVVQLYLITLCRRDLTEHFLDICPRSLIQKYAFAVICFRHNIVRTAINDLRPWDYPENFGIYSQIDRISKTCFLFPSMCMFPELNGTKS